MRRLLISGLDGRMGSLAASLAQEYGFEPRAFAPDATGDVILDFSHPDCLEALLRSHLPLVIGTTGFSDAQQQAIRQAAERRPILQSANFSRGVCVLQQLIRQARHALPDWQASLVERHHAAKQDQPSGTALALAGSIGLPPREIHAIRAGTIRGAHELTFYGLGETLTLLHCAESREIFARGALQAAQWLLEQGAGLYGMEDWAGKM